MATTPTSLWKLKNSYERGGLLPASAINQITALLSNITGEGGIEITTDFGRGLKINNALSDVDYPWKVRYANIDDANNEIRVTQGRATRFGNITQLVTDTGETYKSINEPSGGQPWAADTTYYVYYALGGGGYNPATNPISVTVAVSATTPPTDFLGADIYRVLATVTTDADANFNGVTQLWRGGDSDDVAVVPDGEGIVTAGSDAQHFSLEFVSTDTSRTLHARDLQVFEWDDPTEQEPLAADLFVFQDVADAEKHLRYVTLDDLGEYISDYIEPGSGEGSLVEKISDEQNLSNLIYHHNLDATANIGGADFDQGGGDINDDHDKRYFKFRLATGAAEDKDFDTLGSVTARDFFIEDRQANTWGDAGFTVDVTGVFSLMDTALNEVTSSAAAGLTLVAGIGTLTLQSAGDVALTPNAGSDILYAGNAGETFTFQALVNGVTKDITVTKGGITNVA